MSQNNSVFPDSLDSFPRLLDGVDTVEARHWNDLASMIEKIQLALGSNPQGTSASVAERLSKNFDADGKLPECRVVEVTGNGQYIGFHAEGSFTKPPLCFAMAKGNPDLATAGISIAFLGITEAVYTVQSYIKGSQQLSSSDFSMSMIFWNPNVES